jgi:hypothetical protein
MVNRLSTVERLMVGSAHRARGKSMVGFAPVKQQINVSWKSFAETLGDVTLCRFVNIC